MLELISEVNSFYNFIQNLEMNQMKYLGLDEEDADLYDFCKLDMIQKVCMILI